MNMKRYKQFLFESSMIQESSDFATYNAIRISDEYDLLTEDQIQTEGSRLLKEMEYWESRCLLEDRIICQHLDRWKEFIYEE